MSSIAFRIKPFELPFESTRAIKKMKTSGFRVSIVFAALCVGWSVIAASALGHQGKEESEKRASKVPNIVLIMADDLGWKDLHCYGNEQVDTPNLDRLATQGLLFTDAYSASPVCTPTRAALMTGESPARLNITNHAGGHAPNFQKEGTDLATPTWLRYLPLERVTLAEQLKQAGYATGFVGKWHLSNNSRETNESGLTEPELRAEHQGFDINIGGCKFGGPPSYFSPYKIPNLEAKSEGEYLPDRCAGECIDFIKSAKSDGNPFFLCWWNYSVHYPFQAPKELIAKYEQRKGPGVENPTYAAMIEGMDAAIGKLLKSIDDQGLSEDTLVIFTSDNGPFDANVKPLRAEKGYLYEGGIRVPMIVRWPGHVRPAKKTATPVITMDIHATILEAANLKPDPSNTPDGISLMPMLKGESELERDAIYFHYPNYAFHKKNRLGSAIRSGDYKLINYYDDDSTELYDLKNDISESNDLANEKPFKAKELRAELDAWLVQTKASQPQPANRPEPAGQPLPAKSSKAKADAPNIVFLFADDQCTYSLGCYGNKDVRTPNMDQLARDGIAFDKHYNTTAICMASRASVFTGMYEYKTGCNFMHGDMRADVWAKSYPVLLRDAGYLTAFAGKFGIVVTGKGLCESDFDFWGGGPNQTRYGTRHNESMRKYADRYPHSTLSYGAFGQDVIRAAVKQKKPFCLSISFKAPHKPATPDPRFNDIYAGKKFTKPKNFGREFGEHLAPQSKTGRQFARWSEWKYDSDYDGEMAKYHQQVYGIDVALGMIRDELKAQGVSENTIVIYTSDNGFICGSHGYGSKVLPMEESSRVPLMIYDPRSPLNGKEIRCQRLTGNIDFAPTMLELANLPIPANMDGKSLLGLLADPEQGGHEQMAFINVFGALPTHSLTCLTRQHKYTYWWFDNDEMDPVEELFDTKNDPLEFKNLAQDTDSAATLNSMRKRYDVELRKWKDQAVDYNNYQRYSTLFDRSTPYNDKKVILKRNAGRKSR